MMQYKNFFIFTILNAFSLERAIFFIYFTENGHSISQVSYLQVILFCSIFFMEIPTGIFGDYYGKKISLATGILLKSLSLILQTVFVENYGILVLSFILYSLSFSFISGSLNALIYQSIKNENNERSFPKILAINSFLDSVSLATAMALGPYIKEAFNWAIVYYSTSIVIISALPVILSFPKENSNTIDFHKNKFKMSLFLKQAKEIFPLALPISLVYGCMTPFFVNSQLLFKEYGKNLETTGVSISSIELVSAIFVVLLQNQVLEYKRKNLILTIGAFLFLVTANIVGSYVISMVSFLIISIIVINLNISLQNYVNSIIKNDSVRASALSFISFLDTVFIALGYLFFAQFSKNFSIKLSISSLGIFPFLALIFIAATPKKIYQRYTK